MQFSKAKIIFLLFFFLGICIIFFTMKRGDNDASDDKVTSKSIIQDAHKAKGEMYQSKQDDAKISEIAKAELKVLEDIEDLTLLESLIDMDVSTLMDINWDNSEIDADFADRDSIVNLIQAMPVKNRHLVSEKVLKALHSSLIEVVFDNGTNDFEAYTSFLKSYGEKVLVDVYKDLRKHLLEEGRGDEKEVTSDQWQVILQYYKKHRYSSRWEGFVATGSEIRIFETHTSELDQPGSKLAAIRQAITTFRHISNPPITLNEMLESEGKVFLADAIVFIAHDDEMGGIVRPYIIRYWYDPVHELWRPLDMSCLQNRFEHFKVGVMF